jgi:hypothetical protein
MPATEKEGGDPPSDGAPSSTVAAAPTTPPKQPRSRRGSLSAAVQGRRSAEQALNPAPEQQARRSSDDPQQRAAPDAKQARRPKDAARPKAATTSGEPRKSTRPSGRAPRTSVPAGVEEQPSARARHDMKTVLTGSGNAEIELTKTASGPAVVHISGNSASRYFAVRTRGTDKVLVMTIEPYDGVRLLDWTGESTGFEVRAVGSWRIEVLPLSAMPAFDNSFEGEGTMVVRFTGKGSVAEITGNDAGRYFEVRAYGTHGLHLSLVETTRPYAGSSQISRGHQVFEVQAIGSWTLTIT